MMRMPETGEREVLYGALVLLVLALFLLSVRPVLSPIVLFLALLLLLSPFAGSRSHRLTLLATGSLTLLWLLEATGALLAPFILALVLAYILDPAVDALERRRVPRSLGILMLGFPVVLLVAALVFFGIPALVQQVDGLIRRAPEAIDDFVAWAERTRLRVLGLDLPFLEEEALVARVQAIDAAAVTSFLQARQEEIAQRMWGAFIGVGRGLGLVFSLLGYLFLTPVLSFYLLRDYDGITARAQGLIPVPRREKSVAFLGEYNLLLSRYLRGQLLAAALVGVLTWLGLWILGFPYAGLVGAVAGVFNVVPYLGLVASLIPALIIVVFSGSILASLAKVAAVFVAVQFLDSSVIGPRIVGGSVGLHPVWIMLALAVGGFFFGFVGLLIAVPAAVLLKLLLREALARYEGSAAFLGTAPDA